MAGTFHYATMSGIAFAGIFLGYLADRLGRKKTIILGLVLFALNSYLFAVGKSFLFFVALLDDFRNRNRNFQDRGSRPDRRYFEIDDRTHSTMNTVEGFFAVGAFVGPAIVACSCFAADFVEVALSDRRHHLRGAYRDRLVCPVPAHGKEQPGPN